MGGGGGTVHQFMKIMGNSKGLFTDPYKALTSRKQGIFYIGPRGFLESSPLPLHKIYIAACTAVHNHVRTC